MSGTGHVIFGRAEGGGGFGRIAKVAKIAAPVLAAIAGMVALRLLAKGIVSQRTLSDFLARFGELAPLVFVLFLGARPLTLLPGQVLTAVGGLLFGAKMGTIYALIGSVLSCALIFALARFAGGGRLMKRLAGHQYQAMVDVTREHNFKLSVIATMNPLVPTDVFIAAASSTRARFGPLVAGVLVGTLPGTYVTALFGSALGQGKTITTAVTATGMVLSLLLGLWLGRTVMKEAQAGKASRASTASRTAPASRSLAAGSSTF